MFSVDPILDLLGRAVDVSSLRHAVHAANVANANTAGYDRLELAADAAQQAATNVETGQATIAEPRVVSVPGETVRLDEEMAAMAQNAIRYQALLGAIEKTMSLLRAAAREGKEG